MPILTAAYAAIFALLLVALSVHVIRLRVANEVSLGDGGNDQLLRAIRGQGNFAEYVPLALVLMLAMELLGQPSWLIHGTGIALLAGRIAHGVCFTCFEDAMRLRQAAMLLTFAALVTGALGTLTAVFSRAF